MASGIEERCEKAKPEDVPGLLDELEKMGFGVETYSDPFFIVDAAWRVGGRENSQRLMDMARDLERSPGYNFVGKDGEPCRNLRLQRAVALLRRAAEACRHRYTMEEVKLHPSAADCQLWR